MSELIITGATVLDGSAADVLARITHGGGHSWVADNDALWAFFSARTRPQR